MTRLFLLFLGAVLMVSGASDLLARRPRYVGSRPEPGTAPATAPASVTITFSEELDQASTASVTSTLLALPSGEVTYGGQDAGTASELDTGDPQSRSLIAVLRPGLHDGLYRVHWRAVAKRGKAARFGQFYFGVGMPVPEHIRRDLGGPVRERNAGSKGTRYMVAGGVLLTLLGAILPGSRARFR